MRLQTILLFSKNFSFSRSLEHSNLFSSLIYKDVVCIKIVSLTVVIAFLKKSICTSKTSSKLGDAPSRSPPQTAGAPNLLITLTVDLEIDAETGKCVTSQEQGRTTGTGFSYPRPPSRAKTIPAFSLDDRPSEDSGQPQRRHSLIPEGVDRSSKDEHEEPQGRVKELEREVETLKLRIEEGKRGMERWFLEMEMLRNDALQREVEAKIREVEQRTEQNATDTPLVVMPSSNSSSIADTHLTPPSNNPRPPKVEEARTHPMLPPRSPSGQQGGLVSQKQLSRSPPLHDGCSGYERGPAHPEEIGCSVYDTLLLDSSVDNLQQVSSIEPTASWGKCSYVDGRPTFPYPSASTDPSYTHLQAPKPVMVSGPAPYESVESIGQFQRPFLGTTIDLRNGGQLPYPHGNAADAQQGFPRFLYPCVEGNLLYPYRPHSPQFLHIGALGYTGENAYMPSPTPTYGGENLLHPYRPQSPQFSYLGVLGYTSENAYRPSPTPMYGSNYLRQSSSSRFQQPSGGDPEDDYFVGGFKPLYLYQPR